MRDCAELRFADKVEHRGCGDHGQGQVFAAECLKRAYFEMFFEAGRGQVGIQSSFIERADDHRRIMFCADQFGRSAVGK